jgi:hypothetical protein
MPPQIFLLILILAASGAASAAQRCLALDGDTLLCDQRKIRLTNVYAAELNETGGARAKRRLQQIVSSGHVTWKSLGEDRYGRMLAEVYVNGRRIEQSDIGPRAGRGRQWGGERHHARIPRVKRLRGPHRAR